MTRAKEREKNNKKKTKQVLVLAMEYGVQPTEPELWIGKSDSIVLRKVVSN